MTTRQVEEGKVFLNGNLFPIVGKVQVTDATQQHRFAQAVWNDARGGMGQSRIGPNGPFNVCEDTIWDIRAAGHLLPGGKTNETTPTLATGGGVGVTLVSELDGLLVSTAGTEIYSFVFGGGGWTLRDAAVPAAPVDIKNGNLGGTEYLVVAYTSGYTYADAVATWADKTVNVVNIEFWDYKFWGIDATGRLWFLTATAGIAGTVEENVPKINLSHGEVVTGLFKARTKSDNNAEILYATTNKRLYAHDFGQGKFTEISDISLGDNNEVAHARPNAVFKGKIYLASGRSIIEWDPVNLTIDYIGFDIGDGLPPGIDGRITAMAASTYELFVGVKAVKTGTDTAVVMGWNGQGWRRVWTDPDTTEVVDSLHFARVPATAMGSTEGGDVEYLYIGTTSRVHHLLVNNSQTRSPNIDGWLSAFANADHPFKQHKFPTLSVPGVTTVALRLKVETAGHSSTVHTKVFVAFDGAAQTQMTAPEFTTDSTFDATDERIEGNGVTTFTFPSGEFDKAGTEFRDIQVALEYSSTLTTKGLDVLSVTLEYLVVEDIKESFEFVLDFREGASALPVEELRAAYVTAKALKTLAEFTFRDDTGGDRNYFVKIREAQGDEDSGYLEEGLVRVRAEAA